MSITVDSRKRDPNTVLTPKYENGAGQVIQYKPVRKISPDLSKLSPLARFIVEHSEGKYIGGFLLNGANVRVEGPIGSRYVLDVKLKGQDATEKMYKVYGCSKEDRAAIEGWLFPIFEPEDDESEYFNAVANAILEKAGVGGRVIIGSDIYEIN